MTDHPLIPLALAFGTGIILVSSNPSFLWLPLLAFLFCMLVFVITRRVFWLAGIVILLLASAGGARYLAASVMAPNDVTQLTSHFVWLTGVVASDVEEKTETKQVGQEGQRKSARFVLDVQSVRGETGAEKVLTASGNVEVKLNIAPFQNTFVAKNRLSVPHYGDKIVLYGLLSRPDGLRNPGAFDYAAYLARNGIYATLTVRPPESWHLVKSVPVFENPLLRLAFALRQAVERHARRAFSPVQAAVLEGILLGARSDLPSELGDDFERTGTAHILATAGLHVGMVVGLLIGFLRFLRVASKPATVLAMLVLLLYALMAGGRPSVVRAVIVSLVVLLGLLLEREPDLPNALALAALTLLFYNPRLLFDPGFQLSFVTVGNIALLMPLAESVLPRVYHIGSDDWPAINLSRRVMGGLTASFLLTAAAQLGAAPLIAYYFNNVSLVAFLANTLIVPVVALVIALGFAASVLGAVAVWLAWPFDFLLNGLLLYIITMAHWCAHLPFASLNVVSPPLWFLVAWQVALFGLVRGLKARRSEAAESLPVRNLIA